MFATLWTILSILFLKDVTCFHVSELFWRGNYFMSAPPHQPNLVFSPGYGVSTNFPNFDTSTIPSEGIVTSRQPPNPEDLFAPAVNVYPAESAKQAENYNKALKEIFEEEMKSYQEINNSSASTSQNFFTENVGTQQTYVSVQLGNDKYSYKYAV